MSQVRKIFVIIYLFIYATFWENICNFSIKIYFHFIWMYVSELEKIRKNDKLAQIFKWITFIANLAHLHTVLFRGLMVNPSPNSKVFVLKEIYISEKIKSIQLDTFQQSPLESSAYLKSWRIFSSDRFKECNI